MTKVPNGTLRLRVARPYAWTSPNSVPQVFSPSLCAALPSLHGTWPNALRRHIVHVSLLPACLPACLRSTQKIAHSPNAAETVHLIFVCSSQRCAPPLTCNCDPSLSTHSTSFISALAKAWGFRSDGIRDHRGHPVAPVARQGKLNKDEPTSIGPRFFTQFSFSRRRALHPFARQRLGSQHPCKCAGKLGLGSG